MIQLITFSEKKEWDRIVKSFPNHDIYYLREYLDSFKIHGDGTPTLWHFHNHECNAICVLMVRDIEQSDNFKDAVPPKKYFDATTPYGYGGFIFDRTPSSETQKDCYLEFIAQARAYNLVSVFFRFHPMLNNSIFAKESLEVIDLGQTIHIDLTDEDIIWGNITSKNRNMIRKAEKAEVNIMHGKDSSLLEKFKTIYDSTMVRDHASPYYFFGDDFYRSINANLQDNFELFYATLDKQIISMAMIIHANNQMHYHLSGSLPEYRHLAPSNLLLYKAALWGKEKGFGTFHLGGGVGSQQDSLYKFKAAFNRNSHNTFSIGKLIINEQVYQDLVDQRTKNDNNFNLDSSFFPLYRS